MTEQGYQGWTNYETWAVNLWLSNDEGSSRYWENEARDAWTDAAEDADKYHSRRDVAVRALADALRAELVDNGPEVEGMYADLLGAAFSEVDWRELAESLIGEREEEEEAA
jgi:hypothetical protein